MTREQRAFGFERRPFEDATERSVDYGQRDVYGSGRQSEYARDYGLRDSGAGSFPRSWEGPFQGIGPRNYQRSDERIREDVCDRLSQHGGVDASDVEVEVIRSEVILRGAVANRNMKRLAEDAADEVPGVRDVRNELRVGGGTSTSGTAVGAARGTTARRTVYGVFSDPDRAEDAVNELRDAGFDRDDISLLARSEREARQAAGSTGAEAKGAGTGFVLGGLAGGALGWLLGAGALAIPGVGPIVALGAIGTTVAGAAAGAVAGGLIGLLVGLGVPEEQARTYEAAVKKGGILVSCGCDDDRELQRARQILERHGASEIHDYDKREAKDKLERDRVTASADDREASAARR